VVPCCSGLVPWITHVIALRRQVRYGSPKDTSELVPYVRRVDNSWWPHGLRGGRAATMESLPRRSATDRDSLAEITVNVSGTVEILFSAGSVTDTLASVVELAVTTIEGCDFAGIFLIDGDVVSTPAHTDPLVVEVDALQHRNSEGPCLDAITYRLIFYANDLDHDLRWPNFAPQATKAGIRSVLALPLSVDSQQGALNLYAGYSDAFGVVDRAKATILASLASVALSTAHIHEDQERQAAALHTGLASREIIGEAMGILMERERISAEQAFNILGRASQHLHIKLREVAQNLIDTGEDPDTGQGSQ
jgi:transcriptional regulator with GAF, ATPase, and Fis domain